MSIAQISCYFLVIKIMAFIVHFNRDLNLFTSFDLSRINPGPIVVSDSC